jgi:Amt family ammonium transporter
MQARQIALISVLVPALMVGLFGAGQALGEESGEPAALPAAAAVAPAPALAAPDLAARVADLEAYINNTPPKTMTVPGPGHNSWMMTSSALVLFMTLPGLALFYGGLVRRKNILSVVAQCFGCAGLVTILWWAFGYSAVFASSGSAVAPRSWAR